MLLPVADVLILERRICRRCGWRADVPSPQIHRMYHSPRGEPPKRAFTPREPSEGNLPERAAHVVAVLVESCLSCWQPNASYETVEAIVPERPAPQLSLPRPDPFRGLGREVKSAPSPLRSLADLLKSIQK